MMELSHSLTLNEEALAQIAEAKRPVFVFEWLRFLDKVLVAAQKSDIKGCQKKLVEQLTAQIHNSPGPPTRKLIGRCLATLFSVGDTFLLFETVNKCNDILRNKDDSPSFLSTKLAAITCIGAMYKKLSRMMGRSYEETVQILLKCLRNMESQSRCEIMVTLEKICIGMENCIGSVVKEIYKAARHCLMDRTMAVRCAAAKCLLQMMKHTTFLYTTELESLASLCFRAFEGSNYDVRCTVGRLLGVVMATTQQAPRSAGKIRNVSLEEVLGIMMTGFLKGGIGFLKGGAGEMIKGTSSVSREIRVGVTHAYVTFVQTLGGLWLERNLPAFLHHVLELAANPKASSTHVDAVYSRKCVSFVFRSVGRMLSEKAQVAACRDFCQIIYQQMNSQDMNLDAGSSTDLLYSQHGLICALQELGCLIQSLGTVSSSLLTEAAGGGLNETVCSVLLHPAPAARLAAAWCLRCTCVALPSQLTPLLDRGTERLESLKTSAEAIGGYSAALAALVGATRQCPLGIPHARGKVLFNIAEDLLRSASQNSRLSLQRTQAGWLIIGSIMTLGPPVVRGVLPRMLLLWRISFPRSTKELESEKARGDAFTWQVTLEGRAGALGAIHSFLASCSDLVTPDVIRRILQPIEAALAMLTSISGIIKSYGQHLKATAAMLRLRLYEALSLLPPQSFEGNYNLLLRLLVAEFTLTENQANTTTSLLRAVCHADDSVILGSWLQETDHKSIEDQMEPNRKLDKDNLQPNSASGSGALEHDIASLYRSQPTGDAVPGPLPLGVAVIDASVSLFGLIFPRVARKHRLQMLEHFTECIRQSKSVRQEAVQINVFTAVLGGMKGLAETKTNFGQDDVRKAAVTLIIGALTNANPILRCAAGEALGRMAQVVGDSRFVAEVTQNSFDRLKSARDVVSRTGHSLALGCVHRYVGGMGSGQHLNTSVSILLALAQDASSPVVQAWALHALALIADSGGPMFRSYVEPTLSLSLRLLLNVPVAHVDVLQCIGKCLSALITTIGPELHGNTNSVCTARSSFLCACAIMQEHHDPLVQAEATACLQQLHMFAPRHVNLSSLVPTLCKTLTSSHLLLRRAAVSCLRQLAQREAKEVCEHALTLASEDATAGHAPFGAIRKTKGTGADGGTGTTETGLPGVLFGMLDTETDRQLVSDIHDTLTSMLQAMAEDNLSQWLSLCKEVLTSSAEASGPPPVTIKDTEAGDAEPDVSDSSEFKASEAPSTHPTIVPRWPTRVFAAASVRRIVATCEGNRAHLDLALARQLQSERHTSDYLVLHLSDVVRMAFMAATSDSDPLRLEGLETLQLIIDRFAAVPEPEFPGHVILEQYQAQVGAALRPAFSADTPSHVTAMACQVCSAWIGSGVARDLNDLRRVHQLLVSSLAKLKKGSNSSQLYNESTATLEKLAILKAWAEVYVIAMTQDEARQKSSIKEQAQRSPQDDSNDDAVSFGSRESLLDLVGPELPSLSRNWLAALRDHAILSLTPEFTNQRHESGAFYSVDTMDLSRVHYRNSWTSILHAATLWLNNGGFEAGRQLEDGKTEEASAANDDGVERRAAADGSPTDESSVDQFYLVFGICMEALCSPRATEPLECVVICLQAMYKLLDSIWARDHIGSDRQLSVELCNVLHRLLLTRENPAAQLKVMDVVRQVVLATRESLVSRKKKKLKEIAPANQEPKSPDETALLGEGGEDGVMVPGQSVVFAILEVCLCVLVRHLPTLNPPTQPQGNPRGAPAPLTRDGAALVAAALGTMADLPELCSPAGSVAILPTVLFLTTGVLREVSARCPADDPFGGDSGSGVAAEPMASALHALKQLASNPYNRDSRCCEQWTGLLRSALAKVLDISKTSSERERVDEVSMVLAVAIFIVSAPTDVVAVPNLQLPCLNLFKQALQSDDLQVRLKTVQTLRSVFLHPDRTVSIPYVHALSTKIIEHLGGREARQPTTDFQLNYTMECLHTFEVVISLAEAQHRIHILSLAIPILVMLLQEQEALAGASRWSSAVHDNSLQRLMKIGLQYSAEFRTVVAAVPLLRAKLEAAIKAGPSATRRQQNGANSDANGAGNNQGYGAPTSGGMRAPSIKLKTDFSNFTG